MGDRGSRGHHDRPGGAGDGVRCDQRGHRLHLPCPPDAQRGDQGSGDVGDRQADPHIVARSISSLTAAVKRRKLKLWKLDLSAFSLPCSANALPQLLRLASRTSIASTGSWAAPMSATFTWSRTRANRSMK